MLRIYTHGLRDTFSGWWGGRRGDTFSGNIFPSFPYHHTQNFMLWFSLICLISDFIAYKVAFPNMCFFIELKDLSLSLSLAWDFLYEMSSCTIKNACSTDTCKVLPPCFNQHSRATPQSISSLSILLKTKECGFSHLFFLWQVLGPKHTGSLP